jgi:hypothetical protein
MRILCPGCGAAYQVPVSRVVIADTMRCGQCGVLFTPVATVGESVGTAAEAALAAGDARLTEPVHPPRPSDGSVPPPPVVTYMTAARCSASTATGPAANAASVTGERIGPSTETGQADVATGDPGPSVIAEAGEPVIRPMESPAGVLGPPPPYRPLEPPRKPMGSNVERTASTQLSDAAGNIRVIDELGPPPPYRPILQGTATFERGPPPDLEPWRLASLMRLRSPAKTANKPAVGGRDTAGEQWEPEADWSIYRETGLSAEPGEDAIPTAALASQALGKRRRLRSMGPDAPRGARAPGIRTSSVMGVESPVRPIAPTGLFLCAAAAGMFVLLGVAFYTQRDDVMRNLPEAVPVYAALGLTHHAANGRRTDAGEPSPETARCGAALEKPENDDGRPAACPGNSPETSSK